jgi:hypothetical protein
MSKRILSIRTITETDTDPDTSYLGQYSHSASEFSINRCHTLDCAINGDTSATVDRLERAIAYLDQQRLGAMVDDELTYTSVSEAQDILIQAQEDATACDCEQSGDWTRGELQYFTPNVGNYKGLPDSKIREYVSQAYQRMERLNAGDWSYIGIRVEAEIVVDDTAQTVSSGGLWGIESDAEYIASVIQDELSDLRGTLHELGFSKRAIATACKDLQEVGA